MTYCSVCDAPHADSESLILVMDDGIFAVCPTCRDEPCLVTAEGMTLTPNEAMAS